MVENGTTEQLWLELRAMRAENHQEHFELLKDVAAIRSKTDKLEARAGFIGALVAIGVSLLASALTFFRRSGGV